MALPSDVQLVAVTCGSGSTFFGEDATVTVEVAPVLGGNLKHLVHKATGSFMTKSKQVFTGDPGQPASFTVPNGSQPETWIDGTGAFFTGWAYLATIIVRAPNGETERWTKSFTPALGQTTIDLDLVPDGQIGGGVSAPVPPVTSVNGQTGAVVVEGGAEVTPEAVAANLPERLSETALSAAIGDSTTPIRGVRATLDIWEGFNKNGTGGASWDASTYPAWIAGIDARLGGKATKATIGTDTDGSPIVAYTTGPVDAPHALVVSGTHGIESLPQWAAMRYFTEFVDNPAMKPLRSRMRLTWVPTLTPSAYLTNRYNSAGVDPARNYDYYWEYWLSGDHPKGVTAMDQPGPQAVKYLLDTYKIACVMDVHTIGNTGTHVVWDGPSVWTLGNRQIAFNAGARYEQTYNSAHTITTGEYGLAQQGYPQLVNWANKYMLFDKKRSNAASLLIETRHDLGGSLSLSTMTQEGARLYCGFIDTYLTEWLENGQSQPQAQPRMTYAGRLVTNYAATISDGGTKVASGAFAPLRLDSTPGMINSASRNFIDVPIPGRGQVQISALVALKSEAGNTTTAEVALQIGMGTTPIGGGNVPGQGFTQYHAQVMETGSPLGDRSTLQAIARQTYTGPTLQRYQLNLALLSAGTAPVEVQRAQLFVTWYPDDGTQPATLVPLTA